LTVSLICLITSVSDWDGDVEIDGMPARGLGIGARDVATGGAPARNAAEGVAVETPMGDVVSVAEGAREVAGDV
jgi:hypothetical protein